MATIEAESAPKPTASGVSMATGVSMPTGSAMTLGANDELFAAFEAFVYASRERLFRAFAAHHGRAAAEDVLADTYAYAWANWARVHQLDNPVGYLFRVGDRAATKSSIRSARETALTEGGSQVPWHDDTSSPELLATLSALPPKQRAAVLLIHGYGWTYREAAEVLGVAVTTVTNDLHRGMEKLREVHAR